MIPFLTTLDKKIRKDEIFTRSAALALYTSFSLAPLVILLISFLSSLHLDLQLQLISQVKNLAGIEAANVLTAIIERAEERRDLSTLGGWIGSLTLLFSASVIFAHLQTSLNKIFESPVISHKNQHWSAELRHFIARRLISFGIVLTFIFISIVSLMASSLLSFLISSEQGLSGELLNMVLSFLLFSLLFSAIFKWIPDRPILNRAAIRAGMLTGLLFMVGKTLIGLYLGQTAVGSAYGAAGSFIVLLFWVYYSSLIIFVGAEIAALRLEDHRIKIHSQNSLLWIPKRIPNWVIATLGVLFLIRLLIPPVALRIINDALETKLGHYSGHIRDLDLALYRGAYQLQDLEIRKRNSDLPPLLRAARIDLAIDWSSLLRKEISGNIRVNQLQLNFIHGSREQTQLGIEENVKHWQDVFQAVIPLRIESLQLDNSSAYFTENKLKSPVPVRLENVSLTATDLRTRNREVASPFYFEGLLQGHAPIKMRGTLDVLSRPARGHIGFELENFNLATLNNLLLLYIPLDITKGQMNLYGEISAVNAEANGYVKFFLKDGDIIARTQHFKSAKHFVLEVLSAFGNWILKNNKSHKIAARIPFEYKNSHLNINSSEAFWSAIKNSWKEIEPGLDQTLPEKK